MVQVMQNPAESYWLAQAKLDLLKRDPVDAANDADALARFAEGRLNELLRDAEKVGSQVRSFSVATHRGCGCRAHSAGPFGAGRSPGPKGHYFTSAGSGMGIEKRPRTMRGQVVPHHKESLKLWANGRRLGWPVQPLSVVLNRPRPYGKSGFRTA